jgi:hypothetical protein
MISSGRNFPFCQNPAEKAEKAVPSFCQNVAEISEKLTPPLCKSMLFSYSPGCQLAPIARSSIPFLVPECPFLSIFIKWW